MREICFETIAAQNPRGSEKKKKKMYMCELLIV